MENSDVEKGFAVEGRGQNLHGRSDLKDQERPTSSNVEQDSVTEALKRGPGVDIKDITVRVEGGIVYLKGLAEDIKEVRAMESIAKNVPGVSEVISDIDFRNDNSSL